MARSLGTAAGSPMPPGKLEVSPEDADAGQFSIRGTIPKHLQLDRLEPYDPSGRQGAVDALLHYADGRIAALEVTSTAAPGRRPRSDGCCSTCSPWWPSSSPT